jgi:hypothetical protein
MGLKMAVRMGRVQKKYLCGIHNYHKRNCKLKISSIFHFVIVKNGWISHILCVEEVEKSRFIDLLY